MINISTVQTNKVGDEQMKTIISLIIGENLDSVKKMNQTFDLLNRVGQLPDFETAIKENFQGLQKISVIDKEKQILFYVISKGLNDLQMKASYKELVDYIETCVASCYIGCLTTQDGYLCNEYKNVVAGAIVRVRDCYLNGIGNSYIRGEVIEGYKPNGVFEMFILDYLNEVYPDKQQLMKKIIERGDLS